MLNSYACQLHSLDYILLNCGCELRVVAVELGYLSCLNCDLR